MVKRSCVLVTSTHVTDLLKCASAVRAACLVPITPCSNQSAQTAITRGWNGGTGLEMVKKQKRLETKAVPSHLHVGSARAKWLQLLLQEIKRFHLQGSRSVFNSRFVAEICHLIWNKLQLFIQNHHCCFIGATISLPCRSQSLGNSK